MITNETEFKGYPQRPGVTHCGGYTRVGNGNHHVGGCWLLLRQTAAESPTHAVDVLRPKHGVRPREVEELEDAGLRPHLGERGERTSSPWLSMTTSSPGLTSRTKSAPIKSSAQDSDARTHPPVGNRPMTSGRNPWGSRPAIIRSGVSISRDQAPLTRPSESTTRLIKEPWLL